MLLFIFGIISFLIVLTLSFLLISHLLNFILYSSSTFCSLYAKNNAGKKEIKLDIIKSHNNITNIAIPKLNLFPSNISLALLKKLIFRCPIQRKLIPSLSKVPQTIKKPMAAKIQI